MLDKEVESLKDVPLAFIRKLLMINTKCRNHTSVDSGKTQNSGNDDEEEEKEEEEVNPLDLVTALYLCADSFLQQEMSLKMSMCQFAVPFLIPQSDNSQCTLMLWALRNIYKEWRPHDLIQTKNYVEDSVVHAQIPLLSFVSLKDCSFSKSQLLNQVLSNAQQSIPYFTHRELRGGSVPKKIANGLVEMTWSLPCGQSNIDVFPKPVAIANMRGDIISNKTQFNFLMQVSAAVFVCLDTMTQEEEKLLDLLGPQKSKLFLVINKSSNKESVAESLKLKKTHIIKWKQNANMAKFCDQITELAQQILDTLGIEHFMREIGQIYESKQSDDTRHLPSVAAELLLDGYPMELLNGDASIIPEKWVTDALMEVHRRVGSSRLLVVSVLGVQSTGKSTLLNTMFGVQLPVSSGRCTRGAYMLFLSVEQELREALNCDFVLLIDTEGLKAPELTMLEDSFEHDNQLATLVIGLSDVTIINIAMENSTDMKDVLQIAVHAFLRMKQLGKRPICHFVHQNVSGVSAHSKLTTERKHLMEQLDEMTQIAVAMENQSEVIKFTDILDYNVDGNNWYIPGLWHGTPPMAPVNSGYSEAVHELKMNVIKQNHTENMCEIPDFLKWMSSLWKSVKHEIFSFRNSLVANAYDSLCKEFSEWEWSFRKCIYSWLNDAETQISNTDTNKVQSLSEVLELDAFKIIEDQTTVMNKKLEEYYKRKDSHVKLVERYRSE
ncbi:interferon-induced very large GTPase 1-like [Sardina pilchardus]|uniref:interferon-induced very large GTPase 1-like n=1 Tax=Sardina pilchardus TaxID=27697 RepID=UPI002E102054